MAKKQIPLRLSEKLYDAIAAWAEDDFRSVNGQIEYLLTECVRQRKKNGNTCQNIWMNRRNSTYDLSPGNPGDVMNDKFHNKDLPAKASV